MSDSVNKLAAKMAEDCLELQDALDEPRLFVELGEALGAASQTLEEAFLTEIRIRLAERSGRKFLETRVAQLRAEKGI
ncbi:hypothetical protein [Pseudooctadecabacter jejudonensis]|uniref:Uncharacterized protein n=1 Tax=Pseudooctadecabacter jejudonensis TaxID=1391910 RepID=A0A1Y5RH40_9RHOB|nr:hypothetical protein [Pseudooctadecabacter jejudonensis]SLN17214.1 hypothetical protein PSJ8397_00520 [Pseudooctadecabacter jejudonensis]